MEMEQTIQEFPAQHAVTGKHPQERFEVVNDKFLRVNLDEAMPMVRIRMGSMVAFTGDINFEREKILEHGFKHGSGADAGDEEGRNVTLLRLRGGSKTLLVKSDDLLAFEPSITHKIKVVKKIVGVASFGLFTLQLEGQGVVAILTHGRPVVLPVVPGLPPVFADPQAIVSWSGNLEAEIHFDVSLRTFAGRSSEESMHVHFTPSAGPGFVVIQPFEEIPVL
ncbi:hypothetical protein KP509_03G038500 [Ceratopteris richardii]|uniref:AIM24 family protein n=1 Tax=Ceratopteris richardii TaxID=49495 RepID=A0A8T2V365_CERRI|nr:hypothetical protein KP509_03G038500 [Ceratopteris richardii]